MPSTPDSPTQGTARRALALAALYVALSIGWRVLVEGGVGVLIVGMMLARGVPLDQLGGDTLQDHVPPALLAGASILQLLGLVGIAVALVWWTGADRRRSFGLRATQPALLAIGTAGGLTVGFFPGWVAQELSRLLPFLDLGNLAMLNDMLTGGTLFARALLAIAIVGVAPLAEELVFRGYLWDLLERAHSRTLAWALTSVLFALHHVDPIHVIAVFFTGLFLGWLRLATGSVWPAVGAHLLNNGLAAFVVLATPLDPDASSPAWVAFLSLAISIGLCAAIWTLRPRTT